MNKRIVISIKNISFSYPLFNTSLKKKKIIQQHLDSKIGGRVVVDEKFSNVSLMALHDINLDIYEGDRLGITGLNGSGKTTLLRVISNIIKPNIGSITINGKINSFLTTGFPISQDLNLNDNIRLFLSYKKIYVPSFEKYCLEILSWADIVNYQYFPFRVLSPGMRARFFFALSTSISSDILIIDEWLGVGDTEFVNKSKIRFQQMVDKCKTLILTSHNKNILDTICNRIIHIKSGSLV